MKTAENTALVEKSALVQPKTGLEKIQKKSAPSTNITGSAAAAPVSARTATATSTQASRSETSPGASGARAVWNPLTPKELPESCSRLYQRRLLRSKHPYQINK